MAMKHCPVCGRDYSDTDGACPFCGEADAVRKTPARTRGGKRAVRFSKQFRVIAGTQVCLILVLAGALSYLLRDMGYKANAAEAPSAPVVMANDAPAPQVPEEPQTPQPEAPAPEAAEPPAQADESPSDVRNEQTTQTPAAPAKEETPVSNSGTADQLKAGKAVVVNAENGVRVRSGPDTGSKALASFYNGTQITIVKPANDGWYEITFLGSGAREVTGYMMGDFLENT